MPSLRKRVNGVEWHPPPVHESDSAPCAPAIWPQRDQIHSHETTNTPWGLAPPRGVVYKQVGDTRSVLGHQRLVGCRCFPPVWLAVLHTTWPLVEIPVELLGPTRKCTNVCFFSRESCDSQSIRRTIVGSCDPHPFPLASREVSEILVVTAYADTIP